MTKYDIPWHYMIGSDKESLIVDSNESYHGQDIELTWQDLTWREKK